MLGEKIGEMAGKITSQRVLSIEGGSPKMESSFQQNGSVLGTNVKETGTYWTVVRPDGTLYGEGHGAMMTKDGKMGTWTGHGVGTTNKDGSATYRAPFIFKRCRKNGHVLTRWQCYSNTQSTPTATHTPNIGNGSKQIAASAHGAESDAACERAELSQCATHDWRN